MNLYQGLLMFVSELTIPLYVLLSNPIYAVLRVSVDESKKMKRSYVAGAGEVVKNPRNHDET
jgi:hypothetical protein